MTLRARDIMTAEVITVTPATPLSEFARICSEDRISGAPVVTVDGKLVGIISRTDLLERVLEGEHNYAANPDFRRLLGLGEEGVRDWGSAESEVETLGEVDEVMQPEVVTVAPDTPIAEIAKKMAEERIHRVVVMKGEKVAGMITSLDLLKHFPA